MRRILIAALFLALAAVSASAYTIVMRDGRRVEIPNEFTVTTSTLTYEVGPGIQVTIQLNSVDIAATERANGEAKGSFLLKATTPKPTATLPVQTPPKTERSITNRDLESYRRARIEREQAYERRRKELGLPSLEERRKELAAIEERTQEQLLNMRDQEESNEAYWRSRASVLRTEIAVNDAQIDFVRRRLDELPLTYSFGAFTTLLPFGTLPFGTVGFSTAAGPFTQSPFPRFPSTTIAPIINTLPPIPSTTITPVIPSTTITPVIRGSGFPGRFHRMHDGRGFGFRRFPQASLLAIPFQQYDYSFERSELTSQLNALLMQRAALKARWRELEEEARRAGAYPGWLR